MSNSVLDTMKRAGSLSLPRIIWQFEPLLLHSLTPFQNWLRRALLNQFSTTDRGKVRLASMIKFKVLGTMLAFACRGRDDTHGINLDHPFLYPTLQTHFLTKVSQSNLVDHIFVSLPGRVKLLREFNVQSYFVPGGANENHGQMISTKIDRDIDILFLGRLSSRRRKMLAPIEALSKQGYNIKVVGGNCYGDERTRILNRTKIVINYNKFPWELPYIRLYLAMRCGAVVMSEPAPDITPFVAGKHLEICGRKEMVKELVDLLNDKNRRDEIAESAARLVNGPLASKNVLLEQVKQSPELKEALCGLQKSNFP